VSHIDTLKSKIVPSHIKTFVIYVNLYEFFVKILYAGYILRADWIFALKFQHVNISIDIICVLDIIMKK